MALCNCCSQKISIANVIRHSCCFGVCPLHTTEDRISWYFWSLTSFSTGLNFTPYNTPETCYTWICGIVRYEIQSWQFADSCNLSFSFITKSCNDQESNPSPLSESWVSYPLCYEGLMMKTYQNFLLILFSVLLWYCSS